MIPSRGFFLFYLNAFEVYSLCFLLNISHLIHYSTVELPSETLGFLSGVREVSILLKYKAESRGNLLPKS
jgi:hypothetical protein